MTKSRIPEFIGRAKQRDPVIKAGKEQIIRLRKK